MLLPVFWHRNLQNSEDYKTPCKMFILRVGYSVPIRSTLHRTETSCIDSKYLGVSASSLPLLLEQG